jgi:uncharacterized repeat protein (TIGR02543 family)
MNKLFSTFLFLMCLFCLTGCPETDMDKAPEFIVTFDLCGGNIHGDRAFVRIPVYESLTIEYLPIPEKEDSTFDGWFMEKKGLGDKFTHETRVYSNLIVYANWE